MKRIATMTAGGLLFLAGLLGVWSTIAFVEVFPSEILVVAAIGFALMIAGGAGLVIRAFTAA
ncbi:MULTISPECIES: hypothetical protein [unclassified Rhodococcus (in: high G+C Gram-positive bacteria)]|jgi:hypothetical protein|uniref:hypothetical protein n=1 Tax=unclassified Rhodococcus (in: high G+C Gram-positive bacteria) TaxID=192944 RepID=UPI002952DDB6|nr:hypothetical protein [Rhodococcus sp. IEGM 1318]MDV8007019.1 hypothetical protein [Rhodococcus sp. IEGM 1318]MDZ7910309.1 hypothetical protein [Rhodococcus sp. (in: high G+C Gram-positive bacteria)]